MRMFQRGYRGKQLSAPLDDRQGGRREAVLPDHVERTGMEHTDAGFREVGTDGFGRDRMLVATGFGHPAKQEESTRSQNSEDLGRVARTMGLGNMMEAAPVCC